MKRMLFSMALFSVLLPAESAYTQQFRYNLPHVANGSYGQGIFRTTFVVFNNSDWQTSVSLKLTEDNGAPLPVTIPGLGTDSSFGFNLPAGASRILQTDGSGSLAAGAACVTSSAVDIGVSSIFSIYDNNGNFLTEVGVGNSEPLQNFLVFVDATGAFNTGLALYNPTTSPASIAFRLLDQSGRVVSTTELSPPLAGGAHIARFVAGRDQLFPSVSEFKGTLEVSSSAAVCALTLRQNSSALFPTYTSLPVLRDNLSGITMIFPQAVNGSYGGSIFKTSFLIVNFSSSPATVTLTLTQDNGSPFDVTMPGAGTGSTFRIPLEPGASAFLQTDGVGAGTAGAAKVFSPASIGAASIFTVFNSQGQFQTEAGVGDSAILTSMTLPVDATGNFDTGVAFHNPGGSPVTMTLRLLDAGGFITGPNPTVPLEPRGHKAKFVSELFPGTGNFQGTLAISATTGVAALTLRQNSARLSYTTLPVASGTSVGQATSRPLLTDQMTGVDADRNITVDKTLSPGYRLSGNFVGEGMLRGVTAVSSNGSVFRGLVDFSTHRYLVAVPAGTYTLGGFFARDTASGGVFMKLVDAAPVAVSGDTTRDITLPPRTLFSVSGRVAIGSLNPVLAWPTVRLTSIDYSAAAGARLGPDGAFSVSLPAGDYQASLGGSFGPGVFGSLYNIGSLKVSGDVADASFSVPATAKLSGRVNVSKLPALPLPIYVDAADTGAPADIQSVYLSPFAVSTAEVDPAGGPYQLILAGNRTYSVQAQVPYVDDLLFPAGTSSQVTLVSDTVMDLNVPDPGDLFVISGRVTDASGSGLNKVEVTAVSNSLARTSQLSFRAIALTDANGAYRLTVPAGTYQMIFTPQIPAP